MRPGNLTELRVSHQCTLNGQWDIKTAQSTHTQTHTHGFVGIGELTLYEEAPLPVEAG